MTPIETYIFAIFFIFTFFFILYLYKAVLDLNNKVAQQNQKILSLNKKINRYTFAGSNEEYEEGFLEVLGRFAKERSEKENKQ